PAHRDSRDGEPPSFHSLPPETGDVSPRTACAACCPAPFSPNLQCSPKQRSRKIMPTISRRQFTAAFGGISVAALAASATTLPAAAEPGGGELDPLRSMRVPRGLRTADGPIWSATATGFAGLPTPELPHGTVGGYGGSVHVVRASEQLARAMQFEGPATGLVEGTVVVEAFGASLAVTSHASILGVGRGAQIVGGGLHLDQVAAVVSRNLAFRETYAAGDWDGKNDDNCN